MATSCSRGWLAARRAGGMGAARGAWRGAQVCACPPAQRGQASMPLLQPCRFSAPSRQFTSGSIARQASPSQTLPQAPFPIFTTIADFRDWRNEMTRQGKRVGFVATMGALHQGHLQLVEHSLRETDVTVVSIFVNPAQFAPTEDLASYPRTLETDVASLTSLERQGSGTVAALFVPSVGEMYPSPDGRPFTQHVADQVGAFVEVAGLQSKMEGASRPTFFRGVATVVTKLFHIIQPDLAFFGQKDIQQAIVLRRLVSDLLFSHPPNASAVRVIPTARDASDGLALSSRNAYLTKRTRPYANVLFRALQAGQAAWKQREGGTDNVGPTLEAARQAAQQVAQEAEADGIIMEILYIDLNDPVTLDNLEEKGVRSAKKAILSGAVLVREGADGKVTRLIDNALLGFSLD